MKPALLSLIIPCYRSAGYLEKTVDGYGKSEDLSGVAAFGVRF